VDAAARQAGRARIWQRRAVPDVLLTHGHPHHADGSLDQTRDPRPVDRPPSDEPHVTDPLELNKRAIRDILGRLEGPAAGEPVRIEHNEEHSNPVAMAEMPDGRRLVIKRAREAWMAPRFLTSRRAAHRIRQHSDLLAPEYLPLRDEDPAHPVLVYPLIPSPTLADIWAELSADERAAALRSWGALIRRLGEVPAPAFGFLADPDADQPSLAEFLARDLEHRVAPAAQGGWPAGSGAVARLAEELPRVAQRAANRGPVLVHNDLFAPNVLCSRQPAIACVGVIDLEDALGAVTEAELAKTELLHGPLFGRFWDGDWLNHLMQGYGEAADPVLVGIFRAYHLLNMGLHAALTGYREHADEVARVAEAELDHLDRPTSHAALVARVRETAA
jgi:aminoglycoside phosphotransferase (APT) family kinase protein